VTDEFPAELKQFIAQHVESLAHLEAALHIRRAPDRAWECAELAKTLYISGDMCQGIFEELERQGIVARNPQDLLFRYACAGTELDRLLGLIAVLYHERRVAVITEIYSKPVKKVQTFADAFRLRRED
jgi:hypothetical protein